MPLQETLTQHPYFEPETTTKNMLTYARRVRTNIQSPGLFREDRFPQDSKLFMLIIFLEIIGLGFFYYFLRTLLFASLFFVADVIFAIAAHMFAGRVSILRNEIFLLRQHVDLIDADNPVPLPIPGQIADRLGKIRMMKAFSIFFYILIILLAIVKSGGFWLSYPGDPVNAISLSIILTYIVVAYLQITITGFYVFTSIFYSYLKRDAKRHNLSGGNWAGNYQVIDINDLLQNKHDYRDLPYHNTKPNPAPVPLYTNATTRNHFIYENKIYLYGLLTDIDFNILVEAQSVANQLTLGLILLREQIMQLTTPPMPAQSFPYPFPVGIIAGPNRVEKGSTYRFNIVQVKNASTYSWEIYKTVNVGGRISRVIDNTIMIRKLDTNLGASVEITFPGQPGQLELFVHGENGTLPGANTVVGPSSPIHVIDVE